LPGIILILMRTDLPIITTLTGFATNPITLFIGPEKGHSQEGERRNVGLGSTICCFGPWRGHPSPQCNGAPCSLRRTRPGHSIEPRSGQSSALFLNFPSTPQCRWDSYSTTRC